MSNYVNALNHEWGKLVKICPIDICDRLKVEYNRAEKKFTVLYYGKHCIIDLYNKVIFDKDSYEPLDIIDSIIILNYLTYSSFYIEKSANWLSLKEIPNGGALFYPAFYKSSIFNITKRFGDNLCEFENVSIKLNGKLIEYGDKGFVFEILPKVKIAIIIWSGDEEMSASSSVLFESSIQHLLHIETIIGAAMNLINRLINI